MPWLSRAEIWRREVLVAELAEGLRSAAQRHRFGGVVGESWLRAAPPLSVDEATHGVDAMLGYARGLIEWLDGEHGAYLSLTVRLTSQIADLESRVERIASERNDALEKICELERSLANMSEQIVTLEAERNENRIARAAAESRADSAVREGAHAKTRLGEVEAELRDARIRCASMEQRLADLERINRGLVAERDGTRREMESLKQIPGVRRALLIERALQIRRAEFTTGDMAAHLQVEEYEATRLCQALQRRGNLERVGHGRWRVHSRPAESAE